MTYQTNLYEIVSVSGNHICALVVAESDHEILTLFTERL